jgi:phenylalanine-4-hydroxylase
VTQQEIIASLPAHLRPFVREQAYDAYSARDQAVWRFIMKHLVRRLRETAHPVYMEGLARTGISVDHIPSMDEMNDCLAQLGWRAVVVDGFVPPAIFMEFQAKRVLVIAMDMRGVDHIFYTPAPDIVHESAGHAPFIVDVDYAEFLQRFGEVGMKAIASRRDFEVYEAVRRLSIVKECATSSDAEIAAAVEALSRAQAANREPSEAARLARLHWWTVEYGLVGEVDDYKIFGAGLLSSLGESSHCLDDTRVRKIPLTVDAVDCPYDITSEQPQLFVTKSCKHLSQVLEEFAEAMCFQRGGAASLRTAIGAGTVCTAEYDTGVQVSGVMDKLLCDAVGKEIYFATGGPTQLAFRDREIIGHGADQHPAGFGSPVGMLKNFSRCLSEYTVDELRAHDIALGERVTLEFLSGISVRGRLRQVLRQEHRNLLLGFEECVVTDPRGRVLFDPSRGRYLMAVGRRITSVFGGTADRERYRLYDETPASTTLRPPRDEALMALYAATRRLATGGGALGPAQLEAIVEGAGDYPDEWLLRLELLELLQRWGPTGAALESRLRGQLQKTGRRRPELTELIGMALEALPAAV